MTTTVSREQRGLGGVGETALWMAASRARESRRPDRLFDDPLAELLAGPDGPALLTYFHTSHGSDDGNPYLPIRTRWFDDYLAESVQPGDQVVGLGAGVDTRAFRLDWPDGIVLFEVDQPAVMRYKGDQLSSAGATPRCDRRVVPVNLGEDWPTALVEADFDPKRRTVWFAEGVLFYLPEELARRVLRDAAKLSAPGSRIAHDLIGTGIFTFPYMQDYLRKLEEAGSPWIFGTDDLHGLMESTGWPESTVAEPGHPSASYGRWPKESSPDLPNIPRIYLVTGDKPS